MKKLLQFLTVGFLLMFRGCETCPAANVTVSGITDGYGNPVNANVTLTMLNQPLSFNSSLALNTPKTWRMTNFTLTATNLAGGQWVMGVQGLSKLLVLAVPLDTNTYFYTDIINSNIAYYAKLANVFAYWTTNLDAWAEIPPASLAAFGGTNWVTITNVITIQQTNLVFTTNAITTTLETNFVWVYYQAYTNTTLLTNSVVMN